MDKFPRLNYRPKKAPPKKKTPKARRYLKRVRAS